MSGKEVIRRNLETNKKACLEDLNYAIGLIEDMKGFLTNEEEEEDAAQAFMEFYFIQQDHMNRAFEKAMSPIIEGMAS